MKNKWSLYGGILCVLLLLLVILLVYLKTERDEDLFRQENPEDTLAKELEPEQNEATKESLTAAASEETDSIAREDAGQNTTKKDINSEATDDGVEPSGNPDAIIDNKTQQDTEQQEAAMETGGQNIAKTFYYEELTQEIKDRINGKSYAKNCDVPYDELRYVRVLHWGFDGKEHSGEMIVNKVIADDVIEIFAELYEAGYPIERMELVDEYDADDNISMAANNSSSFNYRVIEGTKRISLHSYGMAIDINPLYNPYVHEVDGERVVTPVEGAQYEDRTLDCPYYIKKDDVCYQAFIKRGFTWGGEWKNNKDYQHFQKAIPDK
jgi:hypothetical protein